MLVGGPACVNTEAVTDPALPRPMSEDYQAPSGAGLSPAAQAVLDAVEDHGKFHYGSLAAAALRAVAERAGQIPTHPVKTDWEKGLVDGASLVYLELLTISFELEAHQ